MSRSAFSSYVEDALAREGVFLPDSQFRTAIDTALARTDCPARIETGTDRESLESYAGRFSRFLIHLAYPYVASGPAQ